MFDLPTLFGGLKKINIELEKADIQVSQEEFSLKFKKEEEKKKEENKAIEEEKDTKRLIDVS